MIVNNSYYIKKLRARLDIKYPGQFNHLSDSVLSKCIKHISVLIYKIMLNKMDLYVHKHFFLCVTNFHKRDAKPLEREND